VYSDRYESIFFDLKNVYLGPKGNFWNSNRNKGPITVAVRSEARPNVGIVGSNPTQGMDACVRLFCVCVVLCLGSGRAAG
jgi:hypothetical protein